MKKLLALLLLISTPAFAEVQYRTNDTPNTTSTIGTMPMYLNNGVVTAVSSSNPLPVNASVSIPAGGATLAAQATGNTSLASIDGKITAVNTGAVVQATNSTIKTADRDGNVFTAQDIGQSVAMDVNIRSGTPTTIAVTNAGVFAVQNTEATGSTSKIADRLGNVFTAQNIGQSVAMDVNIRSGTPTTINVNQINGLSPAMNVGTATAGTLQVVLATPSTVRLFDSTGNTIASTGGGALRAQSATGSVVQTIVGVDGGWLSATQSTLSTVVQQIKGSKGNFGGYFFYNPNSSAAYLQVFDSANAAGCTLTTLKMIIGLPATAGANMEWSNGISMSSGIFVRSATTATGNTANSTPIQGFVAYK